MDTIYRHSALVGYHLHVSALQNGLSSQLYENPRTESFVSLRPWHYFVRQRIDNLVPNHLVYADHRAYVSTFPTLWNFRRLAIQRRIHRRYFLLLYRRLLLASNYPQRRSNRRTNPNDNIPLKQRPLQQLLVLEHCLQPRRRQRRRPTRSRPSSQKERRDDLSWSCWYWSHNTYFVLSLCALP